MKRFITKITRCSNEELWERLTGCPVFSERDKRELRAIVAASGAIAAVQRKKRSLGA